MTGMAAEGESTVYAGCAVFDGAGESSRTDQAIWVVDGTIRRVGGRDEVLAAAERTGADVVDLQGGHLMPGLINMHVHLGPALPGPMGDSVARGSDADLVLRMAGAARRALRAGVTTARLVGESRYADFALRRALLRGDVVGPRLFTAGHALCCTGGHGHDSDALEADGADGFRRATRAQLRAGADLIKVCISGGIAGEHERIDTPQMTDEEMAAVIGTAHDWGRTVTAHAGPSAVIARAVELGVDGIEHGYQLTPEVCALMAERGVRYVPTITVSRCREFLELHQVPEWMIERSLSAAAQHWASLQTAIAAGVTLVMGSDMPPDAALDGTTATVREMELMAQAGMEPAQVLRSATSVAADWLGSAEQLGTLRAGAAADFLVLDADPAADVAALRTLHAVVQAGRAVRDDRALLTGRSA